MHVKLENVNKVQERLFDKVDTLNKKTASILEKIEKKKYLGPKFGNFSEVNETGVSDFLLSFTDVNASPVSGGNDTSFDKMQGNLTLTTYDKRKQSVKLQVTDCELIIGKIPYGCGFGKARVVLQGNQENSTSFVLIAFLEDGVQNQIHSTLKLFLQANDTMKNVISGKKGAFSVLGPQSVVSHQYFLNGTGNFKAINSDFTASENNNGSTPDTNDTDTGIITPQDNE